MRQGGSQDARSRHDGSQKTLDDQEPPGPEAAGRPGAHQNSRQRHVRDRPARTSRGHAGAPAFGSRARAGGRDRGGGPGRGRPAGRRQGRRLLGPEGRGPLPLLSGAARGVLPRVSVLDPDGWRQLGADARLGLRLHARARGPQRRRGGADLLRRLHGHERPAERGSPPRRQSRRPRHRRSGAPRRPVRQGARPRGDRGHREPREEGRSPEARGHRRRHRFGQPRSGPARGGRC